MRSLTFTFLIAMLFAVGLNAKPIESTLDLYGAEPLFIIKHPERIDACVLGAGKLEWIEVSDEGASVFQKVLTSEDTYLFDTYTLCTPDYHVRLRFSRRQAAISIDLCMRCGMLLIHRNEKKIGGAVFLDREGRIMKELRRIFPRDKSISESE